MASVTLAKIKGEFARRGLAGVASAALGRPVRWLKAYRELGEHRTFVSSRDLLAYTRSLGSGWFSPWQFEGEICALLDRVRELRPRTLLEIGTANGGTLFMLSRVAAADALLISLDLPCGEFGGGYPAWRAPLYRRFALPGQRVELLRGDSHDPAMAEKVRHLLGGRGLDLLFIDGDHTYEGVKRDHDAYGACVRNGGLIGFHDIQPIPNERYGVARFWREIRDSVNGVEWIASEAQEGCGIGIYVAGPGG